MNFFNNVGGFRQSIALVSSSGLDLSNLGCLVSKQEFSILNVPSSEVMN